MAVRGHGSLVARSLYDKFYGKHLPFEAHMGALVTGKKVLPFLSCIVYSKAPRELLVVLLTI